MGGSKDNERKETAAEIAASQVAVKELNLYNSELKQFEDSFIQRVNNFNTDSNMADVKQAADLSYNREYDDFKKFHIETILKIPGHMGLDNVDVWFQDEARFGQQNTTTRL